MATYFHGAPEIQPDSLQTLYLMNPSFVGYSDASAPAAAPSGMLLLNPAMSSVNPVNFTHSGAPVQNLHQLHEGIPLQTPAALAATAQDSPAVHSLHYDLWHPPPAPTPANSSVDVALLQFGPRRPPAMATAAQRTLSLSLSPREISGPATEIGGVVAGTHDVKMTTSSSSASGTSNGGSRGGLQTLMMGSKYLKATQELLAEVVNVDKDINAETTKSKNLMKNSRDPDSPRNTSGPTEEEISKKRDGGGSSDLTNADRQELQMKKAKLVSMLDEVEHRYRQYHHQMQIVVSSFEAVAGYGSARTYTALALQTISKQFRCLRDAITGQIRSTSKSLGEEEPRSGSSRLRFVDHHLRQQRALQQLGMMQQNAWRPQRGLPERSVSILRAWLFEHFLHPYPKDSDKLMLARQTGLTRSQVSNWFINARVRLWKPMVEEMYAEEMKDQEQNTDENASKSDANESPTPKSSHQANNSLKSAELSNPKQPFAAVQPSSSSVKGHEQGSYYDTEAFLRANLKKTRTTESLTMNPVPPSIRVETKQDNSSNQDLLLKFMDGGHNIDDQGYPLLPSNTSHGSGYGGYIIGDLGRFDAQELAPRFCGNGGSISLTLGLQHPENRCLSLSGPQPSSFLSNQNMAFSRRLEMSSEANDYCGLNPNATVRHPSNGYESITVQDGKRFAAQLLQTS